MEVSLINENINSLKLESTNTNIHISPSSTNNFRKSYFKFNKLEIEIAISIYSNLLFVIINSNGKLGSFCVGEVEQESLEFNEDPKENIITEVKCILGNRKDEVNQFFNNAIINYILAEMKNTNLFDKIKKVLLSTAIKYEDLADEEKKYESEDECLYSKEFKQFISEIMNILKEILNI
jgi:hypothetical protein